MKTTKYRDEKLKRDITFLEEDIDGEFEAIELPGMQVGDILYHCVGNKAKIKKFKDDHIREHNLKEKKK